MLYLKSYLGLLTFTRFSIPSQIFILKIFHFIDLAHMAVHSPSARHHSRPKIRKKLPRFLEAISNSCCQCMYLLNNFIYNTGTNCTSAFSDSKSHTLFDSYRSNQFNVHYYVITGHYHFTVKFD